MNFCEKSTIYPWKYDKWIIFYNCFLGICDTNYRLQEAHHTSLIIRKKKDLHSCRHSSKHLSLVQSQFYKSSNPLTHSFKQPFIVSDNHCEITIDHNVIRKVECHDQYLLKPFSNENNDGIQTQVRRCSTVFNFHTIIFIHLGGTYLHLQCFLHMSPCIIYVLRILSLPSSYPWYQIF